MTSVMTNAVTSAGPVMIIDDDPDILAALAQNLALGGYEPSCHRSGGAALAELRADFAGVVLSDLRMPRIDGREVLRQVLLIDPQIPVVLMSAHADVGTAMQAMRGGAYDFVTKPFDTALLQAALRRASEWRRAVLANRELSAARSQAANPAIVAESLAAQTMLAELAAAAHSGLPCLIMGEAGSGTSTAARELHRLSTRGDARSDAPLVVVDCPGAALAGAESLLFGHASGAFVGATMPRTGEIERANRGTLLLDRIDGLPPALLSRMIRLVDHQVIVPLGSDLPRAVNTRCAGIAQRPAGDIGLDGANASLLYKLAATRVQVPPLRDRRADIEPLFRQFFAAALAKAPPGAAPPNLSAATWAQLTRHDWPGNLNELQAYAMRAAGGGAQPAVTVAAETTGATTAAGAASLRAQLAQYEAAVLREALRANGGEARLAAQQLGLPRKTFYERLARHGIVAAEFRR